MTTPSIPLVAALTLAASLAVAAPRQGLQPLLPEGAEPVARTYGLVVDEPTARIIRPGVFQIDFETEEPTPPPVVYVGLNKLDEDLDYARYRDLTRAKGAITDLATTHSVEVDFRSLVAKSPNTPFEPRVCYRIEVFVPGRMSSRFIDGRVYFDPATLGDTVNVTAGPFVDMVTTESAVVSFETDRPAIGSVAAEGRTFVGDKETTRHFVTLHGLKPGATVEYAVSAGATRVRPYAFRTQDGGQRVRFAAMVDSREGLGGGEAMFGGVEYRALHALGTNLHRRGTDFIVFGGDLINGYTSSVADFRRQLNAFRRALAPLAARMAVYEGMGNHEALVDNYRVPDTTRTLMVDKMGDDSAEAVFGSMFNNPQNGPDDEGPGTPTYKGNVYHFDHGPVRVFVLNNNYWWCSDPHKVGGNLEGNIMPRQIAWLRAEVARADKDPAIRHLFFVAQEPPYPNGGHTNDAMWYRGGDTNRDRKTDADDIDIVGNRNTMWEIIAASPKSVAFITGDEHAYSRLRIEDSTPVGHKRKTDGTDAAFRHPVWQVTAGGAGAPWYDKELDLPWSVALAAHSTQPHYAWFDVDGGRVKLEVYSQTGQLIDEVVLKGE